MIEKNENLSQRQINAIETKKDLARSAVQLFTEKGFDNVTIDQITEKAGVSKGSFYTHFPSKDSVLVEEFAKIDRAYIDALKNADEDLSNSDKLRLMFNTMTDYCENVCGLELIRVVYINQISTKKAHNITNNKSRTLYTYYDQIISDGIKSGEFKTNLPKDTIVEYIVSYGRSLLYDWCLYNGSFSIVEKGKERIEHVICLLENKN